MTTGKRANHQNESAAMSESIAKGAFGFETLSHTSTYSLAAVALPPCEATKNESFQPLESLGVCTLTSLELAADIRSFSFQPRPSDAQGGLRFGRRRGKKPVVSSRSTTRVQPPRELVKLEDRLRLLLQPSIECLAGASQLTFPCEPFEHQLSGASFLYARRTAVLADEMGLGKTMQAVTAARLLLHAGEIRRLLLLSPKPLMANWMREFAAWAPELPVSVIEGDPARRRWLWRRDDCVVTLANYELLQRDEETLAGSDVSFDLVILDESQRIKNPRSGTSQAARRIHRRRSWALTGTPVENSPRDLVGLFEFLSPGLLHEEMSPAALAEAVQDYVLRRTKDEVLTNLRRRGWLAPPPSSFPQPNERATSWPSKRVCSA